MAKTILQLDNSGSFGLIINLLFRILKLEKKKIAVLFGGCSVEHEISLISARSVIKNIDSDNFDILPVFINKSGKWLKADLEDFLGGNVSTPDNHYYIPSLGLDNKPAFYELREGTVVDKIQIDLAFPVLHGTYGEDGTVQGAFELMGLPYVGASVLGSSIGMDKIVMKSVLRYSGLPVTDFVGLVKKEWENDSLQIIEKIVKEIGFPCFVKSADLGSSVGIYKVKNANDIEDSINSSFRYSGRVIVEKAVKNCREIEISVLGNEDPSASVPGEIVPAREFYDYIAKYEDESTRLEIPARLSDGVTGKLRSLAIETFKVLDCSGLGRIDFLMDDKTKEIYISEINTIPGFTSISMYPKLWEATGISYRELVKKLIDLAIEKFEAKRKLETDYVGSN